MTYLIRVAEIDRLADPVAGRALELDTGVDHRFTVSSRQLRALKRELKAAKFRTLKRQYKPKFQVFDGTQVVGCGVLRGMGRTRPAAWFNLLGYWVIGLPLGGWLALRAGFGLDGIWWGLAIGLAIVSGGLVAWIHRRGPAQVSALV